MRLVCITDLHGSMPALGRIFAEVGHADAILLGGDITHFGSPIDAERAVRAAQDHAPLVLTVVGNTDSAAIEERLAELGVSAHGRGVVVGSVGIHGLSGIPPWKKGMFGLTEEELAAALESGYAQVAAAWENGDRSNLPERPATSLRPVPGFAQIGPVPIFPPIFPRQHVLLAHVPPRETTLDRTFSGVHAGSAALRAFIEERHPALVFCGHIHEARGIEQLGRTTVVNCGHGATGHYAVAEMGDEVRVELGKA